MASPNTSDPDPAGAGLVLARPRYGLIVAAGVLPLVALLLLFAFDVPIGQPFFLIYRYSPFWLLRVIRVLPALAIGLVAVAILYRAVLATAAIPYRAWLALLFCYIGVVAWTFVGPPSFVELHAFNLFSPSHEGAFFIEAREVRSVRAYLSRDFYLRLQRTPEEMRGRRVLSNPPGTTLVAVVARRIVEEAPLLRRSLVAIFDLDDLDDEGQQTEFAAAMLFGMILAAAWGAGILPAYWLCRLRLPQTAAICVAFAVVFNPAAVLFTPGKDPAQLLTVLLILAGWAAGYVRRVPAYGVLAGASFTLGAMFGLVHVWVLGVVSVATLAHAMLSGGRLRDWVTCCCLPAAVAAAGVAAVAWLAFSWNLLRTMREVAARYAEIQLPIVTDPFYWTLVGLPMFLLFVGPLYSMELVALRERAADDGAALGRWLLWCSVAVMGYSYFFGNNSETPRLWIPFIPPLLLAMAIRRAVFRDDSPHSRRTMVLLLGLQLVVTLAFWSLMDVRESEWRLLTGRMWD